MLHCAFCIQRLHTGDPMATFFLGSFSIITIRVNAFSISFCLRDCHCHHSFDINELFL